MRRTDAPWSISHSAHLEFSGENRSPPRAKLLSIFFTKLDFLLDFKFLLVPFAFIHIIYKSIRVFFEVQYISRKHCLCSSGGRAQSW